MRLSKLKIKNYRLLVDAELDVDDSMTLIVGRNNTAKTSCSTLIEMVTKGKSLSYDDYPLSKRDNLHELLSKYLAEEISYAELCEKIPVVSIEFWVDYSLDDPNANLGTLSPFIIDVDIDTTLALIRAEYKFKMDEDTLQKRMQPCFYTDGKFTPESIDAHDVVVNCFSQMFEMVVYAINPKNNEDRQIKSTRELTDLFPFYSIPAERVLGEDGTQNNSSLAKLITTFFEVKEDELDPKVSEQVVKLRQIISEANKDVQRQSDSLLSSIVNKAIGFGYPNGEELKLAVITQLNIDDQVKNQTQLAYTSGARNEMLPSTHNGLGYKNLIKMEFLLAACAKELAQRGTSCIPLLFIEEPESHMHPQMQHMFAEYLETFLEQISDAHIQTFLTSHSAHIANTVDFSQIRYAQKSAAGVKYKNLQTFAENNPANMNFIKKYLTLSRCDLFFAEKVILVEGASERLLLPDMMKKCDREGVFDSQSYKLPAQYYALIEVGGAYAHLFVPFMDFLDIPCLILTDLDPVLNKKSVPVSKGDTTSNATIKWWMRQNAGLPKDDKTKILLSDIMTMETKNKTRGKCHIEFQTQEAGLCGHSLEEAIRNVNREHFGLAENATEEELEFTEKGKTDFALKLVYDYPDYSIPRYIKDGLAWLNEQKVLV